MKLADFTNTTHERGFSLLELLIAFTVTAMSLMMMFQLLGKANHIVMLGNDYANAVTIAESRLAELDHIKSPQASSGVELDRYHWQVELGPAIMNEEKLGLLLQPVVVDVDWLSHGKKKQIKLESIRAVY